MMKTSLRLLLGAVFACLAFTLPAMAQSIDSISDVATKLDVPPRPLKTKPPSYPAKLREQGITGAVVIVMVVDEAGKVIAAEVSKASHDEFRDPAIRAVRDWTFSPAQVAGKAVRARVTIPLNFSIEG